MKLNANLMGRDSLSDKRAFFDAISSGQSLLIF